MKRCASTRCADTAARPRSARLRSPIRGPCCGPSRDVLRGHPVQTFVGRQQQLAELRDRLSRARAGEPQCVGVLGPAGIGKTALLDRFVQEVHAGPGTVVVRASGDEAEVLLPFGLLDQLVRAAGPDGAGPVRDAAPPGRDDDPLSAGMRLLELFGAVDPGTTLVLVLDDLHWADLPSLRALTFALRRLVADEVLTVLALRDDALPDLPAGLRRLLDTGVVIKLRGLDVQELTDLAGVFGVAHLPPADAERLRSETQGNPLHARAA